MLIGLHGKQLDFKEELLMEKQKLRVDAVFELIGKWENLAKPSRTKENYAIKHHLRLKTWNFEHFPQKIRVYRPL